MEDKKTYTKDELSSGSSCEDNEENKNILNSSNRTKINKGEKRARKLLVKLGLKPVNDVRNVIIKKSQKMAFTVANVDVYKIEGTDSYVIFGDAQTEDIPNPLNNIAEKKPKDVETPTKATKKVDKIEKVKKNKKATEPEEAEVVDEELDEAAMNDVKLIMSQTQCTKEKAIATLKKNNYDLVQSIMELCG
ncbi:nascent polypeptide-associated complex subunit alpha, putative [Hepatocystis sp. ex Piliocolobus tephrosceles]|nr:nascent polypeptide-associated complex subunit alpha, putative [Hepatocystis sp. ex Piliocolobus tephrosceles]